MRFTNASNFKDRNELLGVFFRILENPVTHPFSKGEIDKIIESYEECKQSYFISCWSKRRDSIAMWELYSPHFSGVQVGVKKRLIVRSVEKFVKDNNFAKAHYASPSDGRLLFYPVEYGDCIYVDYDKILSDMKEKFFDFYSRWSGRARLEEDKFKKEYKAFSNEMTESSICGEFLKDIAYRHEEEFRFVLRSVTRNDREYEDCRKDPFFVLFDSHLRGARLSDFSGNNIFLEFDSAEIDEVWIDSRMPDWKKEVQIKILRDLGVEASVSGAYGRFFDRHDLTPMRD